MTPIAGWPILTAAAMRAAEAQAAPDADAFYALMERAGLGVARSVYRLAGSRPILVLCGPGNNGGDGYVAARWLRAWGCAVEVAALTPPRTDLARRAAEALGGAVLRYSRGDAREEVSPWPDGEPASAPVVVDALFGTGAGQRDGDERWISDLRPRLDSADLWIAVDLPLGLDAEGPSTRADAEPRAHVTLALGALKPAHVLPVAQAACGAVRVIDLGLDLADQPIRALDRPGFDSPGPESHKFSRGMVAVAAGAMPGAARLAATAAARAGAGYVAVFGTDVHGPAALVQRPLTREALSDKRIDVVLIGPGLGRDDDARGWVEWLLRETSFPLVIDGDALHLLDPARLPGRAAPTILTPHAGEHARLVAHLPAPLAGDLFATAMEQVRALAGDTDLVMVAKGATTVIASATAVRVASGGNPWLSTAGTGDVLAGTVAACLAIGRHQGRSTLDTAAQAVWLHAEAARRCGASFIADDLAAALSPVRAAA